MNQIAPLSIDETALHEASSWIAQEASQVATEQPTLEAALSKPDTSAQETAHEAFKNPMIERIQEINQETTNAINEKVTMEVAEKDTQSISEIPAAGSPQKFFHLAAEQITSKVAKSEVQILSQEIIQEASETLIEDVFQEPSELVTEKLIPKIAQETFEEAIEVISPEAPLENLQINVENSVHEDKQEVSQVLAKEKLKENSRDAFPATIEETAQEITQERTEDIILEVSQEPSQITTEKISPDTAESEPQDLSHENIQEDSQVITENSTDEDTQKVPQLNTGDIDRKVSQEPSQLLAKDKLKETIQDRFSVDIEGTTSIIASSHIQGIPQETVQENTQIAAEEIKTEISHADIPIVSDSKPSEARRQSRVVEEKKRGQRLFGGLLSTLSQSSPNGQQRRRLEIEKRQLERAKIRKVQDNVNKVERIAKLNAARIKEQSKFKKESFQIQKSNMLAMANFLCTKTEPKLYYKPWELLPEQEEEIKSQIASTSAKFKGSESSKDGNDQVRLNDGEKLNESSMELVGEPHTEPPNIAVVADAHNAATSVIPPTTNDIVDYPNKDSKAEEREREEHNCEVMVENEEDTVIY
ncbi:BgTH12-00886 [Blumeria graminis f. sp. triticale]|uniref:BgTH12-00886 n=1 Tax=Blumeria graminis f. sp. triticale TaxID=1689686 RepID=A0A9W4DCM8_BLUGR|nr:BgTH12-00886 [Blumeria graminis f. sp. triticale]